MTPGRYATQDGSFVRSAGSAGARGVALLAVALLIGVVLLNATDTEPPGARVSTSEGAPDDEGGAATDGPKSTTTLPSATTTTLAAHQPKDVKVIVFNVSDVKGAAGKASDTVKPAGYNVLAPGNAPVTATSVVYFTPGYDRDAAAIAAALAFPATAVKPWPSPPPIADTKGANVVVLLAADQASRFAAAPAATTTTAKAAAGATTTVPATTTTKKP